MSSAGLRIIVTFCENFMAASYPPILEHINRLLRPSIVRQSETCRQRQTFSVFFVQYSHACWCSAGNQVSPVQATHSKTTFMLPTCQYTRHALLVLVPVGFQTAASSDRCYANGWRRLSCTVACRTNASTHLRLRAIIQQRQNNYQRTIYENKPQCGPN